jgi:hypothetical protein
LFSPETSDYKDTLLADPTVTVAWELTLSFLMQSEPKCIQIFSAVEAGTVTAIPPPPTPSSSVIFTIDARVSIHNISRVYLDVD